MGVTHKNSAPWRFLLKPLPEYTIGLIKIINLVKCATMRNLGFDDYT